MVPHGSVTASGGGWPSKASRVRRRPTRRRPPRATGSAWAAIIRGRATLRAGWVPCQRVPSRSRVPCVASSLPPRQSSPPSPRCCPPPARRTSPTAVPASQNRYVLDVMRDIYYWNTELPATVNTQPLRVAGGPARGRALPAARRALQLHRRARDRRGVLLGQPVHRLRLRQQLRRRRACASSRCFPTAPRPRPACSVAIASPPSTARASSRSWPPARSAPRLVPRRRATASASVSSAPTAAPSTRRWPSVAVTIPTVSVLNVYEVDGRKIGYLFFRNFVTPSRQALDDAFNALRDVGATELVLDLRYNGGGLVSIAQHLASLIGGDTHRGAGLRRVLPQRAQCLPQRSDTVRTQGQHAVAAAARRGHHRRFGVGERARDQRAAAVHPGDDGGRDDLRKACRSVRHHVLRQGAVSGRVHAAQRAWTGRLLQRHRGRLSRRRRRRITSSAIRRKRRLRRR